MDPLKASISHVPSAHLGDRFRKPGERLARPCQCEHAHHGRACTGQATQSVRTLYGTYQVCADCALCMVPIVNPPSPQGRA